MRAEALEEVEAIELHAAGGRCWIEAERSRSRLSQLAREAPGRFSDLRSVSGHAALNLDRPSSSVPSAK